MQKPILLFFILITASCGSSKKTANNSVKEFPDELVHFVPYKNNPVFAATGAATWDNQIRERGWILREGNLWNLWYTGYTNIDSIKFLGYATSNDGIIWTRYKDNPIHSTSWIEDVCVVKDGDTYYMFSEGKGDTAHMLTSTDKVHWAEKGNLDIRLTNGNPISKGPYGTPSVLKEKGVWYLFMNVMIQASGLPLQKI